MTRRPALFLALALPLAAGLISCGGSSPTAAEPAANVQSTDSGPASGADGSSADSGQDTSSTGASPADAGGARPGGPQPGAVGGNPGAGRPGGPFDVPAFENRGAPLAEFRPFGADHCSGGACVLVEKTSTDPNAQQGCEIADFAYDPPARPPDAQPADQFIQRGTVVTVFVHCPPDTGGSSGDSSTPDSSAPDSSAPDSSTPDSSDSSASSDPAAGTSSPGAGG